MRKIKNKHRESKIYFRTPHRYPLADENWFHFIEGKNNIYFENNIHVNPTGEKGITESFISFNEAPNKINTNGENPISTTFELVNENGRIDDPVFRIIW
ncbi:hypothetical protein [Aquimarina aquimarini]|uniref:hypothetical protein n=1 Tax=Aquimarina aquimarini TaxID=1191734 RepID=UPI000D55D127|nr:hypothetical protein [Aquimarina aquimarini]